MNARSSTGNLIDRRGEQMHKSIIVTTQPELFEARLSSHIGRTIAIFDNSESALRELNTIGCDAFYADFRQLEDRWSGQRFLRYIRERTKLAHVEFWMMAEQWHAAQEEFAIKCGAKGMIKRTPQAIASRLIGNVVEEVPKEVPVLAVQFDGVDSTFGRFAGPMRSVHVKAVREAMAAGKIEPTREAYVDALSHKLSLEERRAAFLKATRSSAEIRSDSDTTMPGDPWMTEVNKIFRRYAGALGARIIISKALSDLEQKGRYDRQFYVSGLSESLMSPVRRQDFISAAREARLIS